MTFNRLQQITGRFPNISSDLIKQFIAGWLGGFLAMNFFHAELPYTSFMYRNFGFHMFFTVWLVASGLFAVNTGMLAVAMDEKSAKYTDFNTTKLYFLAGLLFSIGAWANYHISLELLYFNDLNSLVRDIYYLTLIWIIGGFGMWIGLFINYCSNRSTISRIMFTTLPLFFVIFLLRPGFDVGAWEAFSGLLDWRDMSETIPLIFALIVAIGINFPLDFLGRIAVNEKKKKRHSL